MKGNQNLLYSLLQDSRYLPCESGGIWFELSWIIVVVELNCGGVSTRLILASDGLYMLVVLDWYDMPKNIWVFI